MNSRRVARPGGNKTLLREAVGGRACRLLQIEHASACIDLAAVGKADVHAPPGILTQGRWPCRRDVHTAETESLPSGSGDQMIEGLD